VTWRQTANIEPILAGFALMKSQHLDALDYGRFFAAFSVLMFHYIVHGPTNNRVTSYQIEGWVADVASLGYLGVDFFFIVSGFVIAMSAASATPKSFVRSRFVRLWPTFLLCMTMTALVVNWSGRPEMAVSLSRYLANWTMIAPYLGFRNVDGVYWTLAYELVFYAMMLGLIALGQVRNLEAICNAWLVAIVGLAVIGVSVPGFTGYFALFCAGCMFWRVREDGLTATRSAYLLLALVVCSVEAAARVKQNLFDERPFVILITVAFFAVFLAFSATRLGAVRLPFARTLGLMTYPLYLLHAYIGYVILSEIGSPSNKWFAIASVTAGMIAASYLVVRYFEQPMKPLLMTLLGGRGASRSLASPR
jgi:peptidoglycan/LPS O-acetylase OafA/YrhL